MAELASKLAPRRHPRAVPRCHPRAAIWGGDCGSPPRAGFPPGAIKLETPGTLTLSLAAQLVDLLSPNLKFVPKTQPLHGADGLRSPPPRTGVPGSGWTDVWQAAARARVHCSRIPSRPRREGAGPWSAPAPELASRAGRGASRAGRGTGDFKLLATEGPAAGRRPRRESASHGVHGPRRPADSEGPARGPLTRRGRPEVSVSVLPASNQWPLKPARAHNLLLTSTHGSGLLLTRTHG